MKLKGHSSFDLELITTNKGYFVKKSSTNKNAKRLQKQKDKQEFFYTWYKKDRVVENLFEIPEITESTNHSFTMKFYNGKNILDILETGDVSLIDDILNRIFEFLRWEFEFTKEKILNTYQIFTSKLEEIELQVSDKRALDVITEVKRYLMSSEHSVKVPTGDCHGDFTFANMIFSKKIVLIDFMDVYLETPLQDIAKLLQEVNLEWSLLMDKDINRDVTKIKIGYQYLRWKLTEKIINTYHMYLKEISTIYFITLFRILPYVNDSKIYNVVLSEIEKVKREVMR